MIKKLLNLIKSLKPNTELQRMLNTTCPVCGAPVEGIIRKSEFDPRVPYSLTTKQVFYKCGTVGYFKHGFRIYCNSEASEHANAE